MYINQQQLSSIGNSHLALNSQVFPLSVSVCSRGNVRYPKIPDLSSQMCVRACLHAWALITVWPSVQTRIAMQTPILLYVHSHGLPSTDVGFSSLRRIKVYTSLFPHFFTRQTSFVSSFYFHDDVGLVKWSTFKGKKYQWKS